MNGLLGELLISANKITEEQLLKVLETQITEGGRLGTNLIELGYISEEELTHFLSEHFHLPIVPHVLLSQVDLEIIQLVPRLLAIQYEMIPFACEGNRLKIAMADPLKKQEISELVELKDFKIQFHVASEVRIQTFLKQYYHSDAKPRFTRLLYQERMKLKTATGNQNASRWDPDQVKLYLELAKKDLLLVQNRDQALQVLMTYLTLFLERVYCFSIKKGELNLLLSMPEEDSKSLCGLNPSDLPLFKEVIETRTHYDGPMMTSGMEKFIGALDIQFPPQVVVFPMSIKGHLVCIFYGDNFFSRENIPYVETIQKLIAKCALALEILILRKKIIEA
ncbi:MAG: hypothetical protein ACE5GK_01945 [Nitrospiria bacterium]